MLQLIVMFFIFIGKTFMAKYAIGDIQGCYYTFIQLLNQINFNPSKDTLYLVGDILNRGPYSLKMLNWLYENQDNVISVLGNHELHLLARYYNLVSSNPNDTLDEILNCTMIKQFIEYLSSLPLVHFTDEFTICHAGVHPHLTKSILIEYNDIFSSQLQNSHNQPLWLLDIYNNHQLPWQASLSVKEKLNFVVNSLTRMRYLHKDDLSLEYSFKGELNTAPDHLIPWFKAYKQNLNQPKIIFGHWSSLGLNYHSNSIAIDTGCVWGRALTALNLTDFTITQARLNTIS